MNKLMLILPMALAAAAHAQTLPVDAAHKYCWTENAGWLNWRDAGQSILLSPDVLSGFAWGENIGYINFGDGTPANGQAYANLTGADFGVNVLPDNRLGGLAWGENIGWVNFGPFAPLPAAQQARYDGAGKRLRGYAWGENIGWINLDHATHFIGTSCPADFNDDGFLDFFDYDDFVGCFETGNCPPGKTADVNGDGFVDFFDYDDYVVAFEAGC